MEENVILTLPRNVVAHQTEASDSRIGLHNPPKSALGILSHRIRFVQNNDFVRWTRICLSVRSSGLCPGSLTGKCLDLLSDYADASFVRGIEFKYPVSKVVWTDASSINAQCCMDKVIPK